VKTEPEGGIPLVGPLARSREQLKTKLSTRARSVLRRLVNANHLRIRGDRREGADDLDFTGLSDVELLRRASKVEPPISYESLVKRTQGCGRVTAREACAAMGLPVQPEKLTHKAQCPRCGHVFGGGK
jgi:hypothetical protein